MPKRRSTVPFNGTEEQKNRLMTFIEEHKNEKGCLMSILQKAQEIYGYLPSEVQLMISESLNISAEEVYGVATFYSQFKLNPIGKYNVSVCMGTACYVKGAGEILDKLSQLLGIKTDECTEDYNFSLEACRCIGACGLAPVITINDDVYGKLNANDLEKILAKYKD